MRTVAMSGKMTLVGSLLKRMIIGSLLTRMMLRSKTRDIVQWHRRTYLEMTTLVVGRLPTKVLLTRSQWTRKHLVRIIRFINFFTDKTGSFVH